jgi:hypothetical protein
MAGEYQMSDAQFEAELRIRATQDQLEGYPFGHPGRIDFRPIIARVNGSREDTLALPCWWKFTPEQKAFMVAKV